MLGIAQIVSWGALYYSFSLFVVPMQRELGWSLTALNGALTCGLLMAGLCAYPVGTLIDRHSGRGIMTGGAVAAAALLLAWSKVDTLPAFYAVWLGLGACMACVLYEPLFVVLNAYYGTGARAAITRLTLIAGFASTVFMPLIETLLGYYAWRSVLLLLATLLMLIAVPVYLRQIPPSSARSRAAVSARAMATGTRTSTLAARLRQPAFWAMTWWFTAYSGTASGLMFQLVPYLKSREVPLAAILTTVALVGPMQVLGRALLMLAGDRATTMAVGAVTTTLIPLALLVLILMPPTVAWLALVAVLFGMANGITTILRGVAPGEWFGREDYGSLMGAMGAPMMVVAALAPVATAAIWSTTGNAATMQWAVFGLAVSGAVAFWLAVATRSRASNAP